MPLEWSHAIAKTTDCAVFVFRNTTTYGGANPNRNDAAEVLIAAHVTEKNVEEFATVDSTPYLSKLDYNINNTLDGHYHFEILRIPKWTSAPYTQVEVRDVNDIITIYATIVYGETAGKFYKLIDPSTNVEPGVAGGWQTDWEEVTDFTDPEVRANTTIEVAVFNDIHDCRSTVCTKNELYKAACVDAACSDIKTLTPYLKKAVYLAGARAKNADNQQSKSETILRILSNICTTC